MFQHYPTLEKERIITRSYTPVSNSSSNFDAILNESGFRNNPGLSSLHKIYDSDYLKSNRPSPYKSFEFGEESLVLMLESLESDLKKIDPNFEFKKISENSFVAIACIKEAIKLLRYKSNSVKNSHERRNPSVSDMCVSCVKMKNLMEEAKFSIEREKESLENTEKHLKHYDSLLAIKENRLREQEFAVENEKNMLEIQKSEICREKVSIEKEKDQLKSNYFSLNNEKENLEKKMQQLEKKYQDVKKILNTYESHKSSVENTARFEALKTIEARESLLKQQEAEFVKKQEEFKNKSRQVEKNFQEKALLIEKMKNEILSKQKKLVEKNEKINEVNSLILKKKEEYDKKEKELMETYAGRTKDLDSREEVLNARSAEIESLHSKLSEEKKRLDNYIRAIHDQKEDLEQEMLNSKRISEERGYSAQLAEERFRQKFMQADAKEKKLDEMIQAVQEEEQKLEERWKSLENFEGISKELESLKEKHLALQKNYKILQQELNEFNSRPASKSIDLSSKIESLRKKEEELTELEENLKRERDEIDMSAALIKQLNEDLEKQKIAQMIEHEKLNELAQELKSNYKECDSVKINISNIEIDKSFKNSSMESGQRILVSDMSPFEEGAFFNIANSLLTP